MKHDMNAPFMYFFYLIHRVKIARNVFPPNVHVSGVKEKSKFVSIVLLFTYTRTYRYTIL